MVRLTVPLGVTVAFVITLVSLAQFGSEARHVEPDFATRYTAALVTASGGNPYDNTTLFPAEERVTGGQLNYYFRDLPPIAVAFRPITNVALLHAQIGWVFVNILSALAIVWLTLRLIGITPTRATVVLLASAAVTFAPLRMGITRGQIDPPLIALALLGATISQRPVGGFLHALATLKPQATLVALTSGLAAPRPWRYVSSTILGWAAVVAAATFAGEPSWRDWARSTHAPSHSDQVAIVRLAYVIAVFLAASLLWRALCRANISRPLSALCASACANVALIPAFDVNLHSGALVVVPLALLLAESRTARQRVVAGGIVGLFLCDSQFAVVHYGGVSHAAVPLLLLLGLAIATSLLLPDFRIAACVAVAVNLAVTLPPLTPRSLDWLSAVGASLIGAVLIRRASARTETAQ